MPRKLAVVTEHTEVLQPNIPATIREAVGMDKQTLLWALRRQIAIVIDVGVPPHALAPLMKQLREIDEAIRVMGRDDEISPPTVDEPFDASAV